MASQAKHTPGPWKARSYRSNEGSIWIDCDAYSKSGKTSLGGTLATAHATGTGSDDPAVQEANARLIAAAPDLLAALKDQLDGHWATWMAARAHVDGAETSKQLFEREPDVIRARALIAKFEA